MSSPNSPRSRSSRTSEPTTRPSCPSHRAIFPTASRTERTDVRPDLTFVAHLSVTVGEPIDLGQVSDGHRRLVPILGGTVDGPVMRGRVLAGGAPTTRFSGQPLSPNSMPDTHSRPTQANGSRSTTWGCAPAANKTSTP
ncbi:DUF3237 family protein [Rhodococcus sp. 1R11]|uniref:DUF3237 family protein n=1 Tax=Rhodococcus sp. 1R11 TaxID=2559614 RepID=UPI001FD6CBE2|nr:DUF3237 family protein [Rhodococcus sp. 1R11]